MATSMSKFGRLYWGGFCAAKHTFHNNKATFCSSAKKGLIVGVYEKENQEEGFELTSVGAQFDQSSQGKLAQLLNIAGPTVKKGKTKLLYGVHEDYNSVAVVGLGKATAGYDEDEEVDTKKENIRAAVAAGVKQLRESGVRDVDVDPCSDAEAAAEGATLALYSYDELKEQNKRKKLVNLSVHGGNGRDEESWQRGLTLGNCQNFARTLMEMPANYLTPTKFAEMTGQKLQPLQNVTVTAHTKHWATQNKMEAFLSVAKGSDQLPVFLEIKYSGGESENEPLVLVGKGVTFDSGGISIKPASNMDLMRGDMGGAANVASAMVAIATLKLPINVIGLIPLCENLINGQANKPGDVVRAMNGKTIQIDNTDAEGRLILADALCYACAKLQPRAVVDLATLTGAVDVALGSGATGMFTTSTNLWQNMQKAGIRTGDRVWRMPLYEHYTKQINESQLADLNNIGKHGRSAGACTAAAFLKEFVTCKDWAHMDIAGVMENKDEIPYLGKGMSGRPMRTLVEFVAGMASKQ
ncbi:cytosol aminopeptidase-like [Amphiura filiformis]|uniref:cytosol aminopeptidase-like n=1 Tax=Amphiura filiformis TaxID=82378 RepID=UPI003B21E9B4